LEFFILLSEKLSCEEIVNKEDVTKIISETSVITREMATTRRALASNLHRNVNGTKPTTRVTRTALGDIGNVAKHSERNVFGKFQKKGKGNDTQKVLAQVVENVDKENIAGDGLVKKSKAMSVCESESVITREVKAMSICEVIPPTITDIDKESEKDPFQCSEYAVDIYSYLRTIEKKLYVSDYMPKQTEINERMRSILIDWLIQVHGRFGLLQETLYLTVHLIDRFLEHHMVIRSKLQLVGVSAMLLASKYEETYAPEVGDFVYITDNSYTKGQIKKMEQLIFKTVSFDLSQPLSIQFLRRNSKAAVADAKKHTLAKYFLELILIDYNTSRIMPSKIAAASLYLAGKLLENAEWTDTLAYYSSYDEDDLCSTVKSIAKLIAKAETSKFQASRTKYSMNKFMGIAAIPELKGDLVFRLAQD